MKNAFLVLVGTSLTMVEATDDDYGDDGKIYYKTASHSDIINVGTNDGILRLMTSLNSEVTASYLIEILAIDKAHSSKRTGTTTITLLVDDVNEEPPSCVTAARVEISSSLIVGDFVYKLDCSDSDTGPNGDLKYNIVNGNTNANFNISQVITK